MVLEVAIIDIPAGSEADFAPAYREVRHALRHAVGCRSVRMTQGIETATRMILMVEWDSLQSHEDFRASPAFATWRAGVGPFFATPPLVEHYADID